MVTPALFKRYPDARALAKATAAELEPQIHSTGFFRAKSKSLVGMARALVERHGAQVPADMDALTELPGVGRKTANVVLGHALGVPGPAGRSPRAARVEPHRHRRIRQAGSRRAAADTRAAKVALDPDVRYADPSRPPHLPAQTAVRSVRRPRRLRLFQALEKSRSVPDRNQSARRNLRKPRR